MSPQITYLICGLVIIVILIVIYYYKDKFTVQIPQIPAVNVYSSYNLEYPEPNSSVENILGNFAAQINSPAPTTTSAPIQPQPQPTALPTGGNTQQDIVNYVKSQLDTITKNYFNKGIKPSIEIDNWISDLTDRLTNIQLKLVELNVKPQKELVFY